MSGELFREDVEAAAQAAIELHRDLQEIKEAYAVDPFVYEFNLEKLQADLEAGDRAAIEEAIPSLIAQVSQEAGLIPQEPA